MPVVAAVDRSDEHERVLSEAATLSHQFETDLHVLHVAGQYETTNRIRLEASERTGEPVEVDEIESAREYAASVAEPIVDSYTPVGRVGYPAAEILNYASDRAATYIVVGGRKRSPVGKALFGSTTQAVLLDSDRPVLVVPSPLDQPEE